MPSPLPLAGRVAVVAGATRGAGRGIAVALGEAGATVYCTGRSVRGKPHTAGTFAGRPENIDDTADMVTAAGGRGVAVRVDHTVESEVVALFERIRAEQGRLDVLVNDISGGDIPWVPFWEVPVAKGVDAIMGGVIAHLITSRHAAPLMIERKAGLIVEITEHHTIDPHMNAWGDTVKTAEKRLAYAMAEELQPHGVAAVAVTPGFMRSETVLESFQTTEERWAEAAETESGKQWGFAGSESPRFVGRAVAALATDPDVLAKSGRLYGSWEVAREYGFADSDGRRPDWGRYWDEHFKHIHEHPPKTGRRWTVVDV